MWPLLTNVLLTLLTLAGEGLTRRVEWTDDDTIIVEATREEDAPNAVFQRNDIPFFYHAPIPSLQKRRGHGKGQRVKRNEPGRAYVHTCYSVLGDEGKCTTFPECFPMLYYTEGEHKGQIKHPVLADLLMSTSGPCQPPPLSFRDDFVPFEGNEEEMGQPLLDLDLVNRKDLICCPSTKSTPIPPSGEYFKPTPSQMPPAHEKVSIRTTPSTSATSTVKPLLHNQPSNTDGSAPDAVAGFISSQGVPTGDAETSAKKPSASPNPSPSVGQWGHRFPTRSTTISPVQNENNISEGISESDESEEDKEVEAILAKFPSQRPTSTTFPTIIIPPTKQQGGDASAPSANKEKIVEASIPNHIPQLTFPPPSGSVPPSTEKTPGIDASVPIDGIRIPTLRPPTKRPLIQSQNPTTSDVYVPVIAVGSITPDDSFIVPMNPSTTTVTTTIPTTTSSPPPKFSSIQNTPRTPKPTPPDAAPVFPFQATKVKIVTGISGPSTPEVLPASHIEDVPNNTFNAEAVSSTVPDTEGSKVPTLDSNESLPVFPESIPTEPTTLPPTTSTERPKLPPVLDKAPCGRLNSSTDPKYPWVAAIKLGTKFVCAGSVIDEYHILTSAACVSHLSTIDIGKLRVYLGERILNSNMDGPTITRKVIRAMRHRGFSVTTLRHDIALLKLSLPIPIGTKRVKPVCLPLEDDSDLMLETSSEATIVGWGSNWNQIQNDETHESKLAVWSKDACLDKYRFFIPETHFDDEDMLCAQHSPEGQNSPKTLANTVMQDVETDGSPLIVKGQNGIYQQIGISSWKLGSLHTFPRVLTRVSAYRHWIEKNRLRP